MTPRITKLRLTDFRSIRGTVDLNLDAPVVLIHGPNGSGKTSLLSGIELGLTGAVASLRRFDSSYVDNLVHLDAHEASISIACRHPDVAKKPGELTIRAGKITGAPLLHPDQRRFYTERSFLAQATLGRLLEIYESSDTRDDQSPLTRFVKDLLGLDALDDLIKGMHPSGHKARLRRSLPLYGEVEAHNQRLNNDVDRLSDVAEKLGQSVTDAERDLAAARELTSANPDLTLDELISFLSDVDRDDSTATELSELRREVNAALSLWDKAETPNVEEKGSAAESELSAARDAFAAWSKAYESSVEAALAFAGSLIADLPNAQSVGRLNACEAAIDAIEIEHERCTARLDRDRSAREGQDKYNNDLAKAKTRAALLDERLESLSEQSGDLARILSELTSFIDGDVCPVCDRDFSEVSDTSLHAHVTMHIARLSQAAGQLQEFTEERHAVRNSIRETERAIEQHAPNILDEADRTSLLTRAANLSEALQMVTSAKPSAKRGDELAGAFDEASGRLIVLRRNQETLAGIRASALEFRARLEIAPGGDEESTPAILSRCLAAITQRQDAIEVRQKIHRSALEAAFHLKQAKQQKSEADRALAASKRNARRAKDALDAADKVRKNVKALADRAIGVRTDIVRTVFNESLNEIWKDLFIRLAPEEPFIPAFALPAAGKGPVEARLETRYRGAERGGNPRAMLSSGNLNTAALTLFLSLHLAVNPVLPWLVIDDPVQSMDEIHIAQFAALLRTLSKQRERQVIIAVHEQPLFDYLALELGPASEGDRLITVELSRTSSGGTDYYPDVKTWDPDRVFRAAVG